MKKINAFWRYAQVKLVIVVVSIILPFNIILIVQNRQSEEIVVNQAKMNFQNILDSYMKGLQDRMNNASEQLFQFVLDDPDLICMRMQKEINYKYQSSKMKFNYTLNMIGQMSYGIDGYYYYFPKMNDILVYSSEGDTIRKQMEVDIPTIYKQQECKGWRLLEVNGTRYLMLMLEKPSLIFGGWINLDAERTELRSKIDYQECEISFSNKREEFNSDEELLVFSQVKTLYLNICVSLDEIIQSLSWIQKLMQGIFILSFLLIPLLYFTVRKIFIVPLKVIIDAQSCLQKNQDYQITEKSHTIEFQEIYSSFNHMAIRLKELKIESYEKELEKRKMELRNIHIQVQPHFLLNTFNLVYNLSSRNEGHLVQEVMMYLSKYFRYTFRNSKELDLFYKELQMIEEYIKVMLIRYPDKIQFNTEIDPEIQFVRIPPLLIQNFVENSIKHGLKSDEILHITVNGEWEDNYVIFEIIDDGNGMSEEVLAQGRKIIHEGQAVENSNRHTGLLNSIKRLKYYYGEEAELELDSEYGRMTVVTVKFPYRRIEVENDSFDCE